jgi:hypothetical protein
MACKRKKFNLLNFLLNLGKMEGLLSGPYLEDAPVANGRAVDELCVIPG